MAHVIVAFIVASTYIAQMLFIWKRDNRLSIIFDRVNILDLLRSILDTLTYNLLSGSKFVGFTYFEMSCKIFYIKKKDKNKTVLTDCISYNYYILHGQFNSHL